MPTLGVHGRNRRAHLAHGLGMLLRQRVVGSHEQPVVKLPVQLPQELRI